MLYATWRKRRCYHLDPIEGGHRKVGIIQASFCTQYNFETGSITNPTTLEPQHFEDSGLFPKDPEVKRSDIQHRILHNYFQLVEDAENNNGFFCESQTVRVRFLKTWNINVPTFLQSCCTVSNMYSRTKRQSAAKDPFVEIGACAFSYINSMDPNALTNSPDLGHIAYTAENKFPALQPKSKLDESCNWNDDPSVLQEQLPLTPFLYKMPFVEYVKNPFSGENKKLFLKVFDSPQLVEDDGKYKTDRSMMLKPP